MVSQGNGEICDLPFARREYQNSEMHMYYIRDTLLTDIDLL